MVMMMPTLHSQLRKATKTTTSNNDGAEFRVVYASLWFLNPTRDDHPIEELHYRGATQIDDPQFGAVHARKDQLILALLAEAMLLHEQQFQSRKVMQDQRLILATSILEDVERDQQRGDRREELG